MDKSQLDTDILSEILKQKNQHVLKSAGEYLSHYGRYAFSAMTVYEIERGLRSRQAWRQLLEFRTLVGTSNVLPINMNVLIPAADLWASGRLGRHPHNDADLIIAATALESGRVLVTGNGNHYSWINGLQIEDWRTP